MSAFRLHPQAVKEMDEIWGYIAADSIASANRVIDELESACSRLSKFPLAGHARPDITGDWLRFWRVRNHLIAYAPETRPVLILGFIHGARNPERIAIILKSHLETESDRPRQSRISDRNPDSAWYPDAWLPGLDNSPQRNGFTSAYTSGGSFPH